MAGAVAALCDKGPTAVWATSLDARPLAESRRILVAHLTDLVNGDAALEAAWMVFSAFFLDYTAVSWTAQLRVRDNRTGRLVFHNDYEQRYETKVFGLIPLFSITSCDETTQSYMQGWCLSALTDRAVADASAFLSQTVSQDKRPN